MHSLESKIYKETSESNLCKHKILAESKLDLKESIVHDDLFSSYNQDKLHIRSNKM